MYLDLLGTGDIFGGNRLTNVAEDVFSNMPQLTAIDLSYQSLTSLDFLSTYAETPFVSSLVHLYLSGNAINLSSNFSFKGFTSLTDIDLAWNVIDNVPAGLFDLNYLRALYLDDNLITYIDPRAFPQTIDFAFGAVEGCYFGETFVPGIIPSRTFEYVRSGSIYIANVGGDGFAKDTFYNGTDGDLYLDI
eukprot:Awhi_evm1s7890